MLAEAGCNACGRKCDRSAIDGNCIDDPSCRRRSDASLYCLTSAAIRLYAAVLPYAAVGLSEVWRLFDAPPPTRVGRERSGVVLMLRQSRVDDGAITGYEQQLEHTLWQCNDEAEYRE